MDEELKANRARSRRIVDHSQRVLQFERTAIRKVQELTGLEDRARALVAKLVQTYQDRGKLEEGQWSKISDLLGE